MNLPLHEACMSNNLRKAQEIFNDSPQDLYQKDADGRIPLHWAVSFQSEEIVSFLLLKMVDVSVDNYKDESGWTPFHIACAVGNLYIVTNLYERHEKPDLNLPTNQGVTALHLAVSKKHTKICEFLLEKGASVRVKDKRSQLPLHRAAAIGSTSMVDLLCKAGSPINTSDAEGWTPLFHALAEGHGDVAVLLVQHGADPDLETSDGSKAVDFAVNDEVKKYFLRNIS
ncbi:probable Probable 26S proteasome regulatory subunit p28 [Zygosaccharomyces bailii]|uniref:BN860_15302g1_1 n=1 Tax=Zygosaccharomyces bailii (strain CLIB 213 / ATCC 58445 / CBS 680 / BCRC 21525 / NBRC 1098 / NCYC 1416 / NRRL Y-2227) TaxID=1333698 RepID=A0A8J2T2F3_ZYGB2|nr:BN860_15302g1_1 [Zygosaccharomyces bailii CLIB 213]CDH17884.1 probable 26S proteasome regulatory subunit p28 [Zygosaccharomyces bailii ISA1307]SJM83617.1 probable Probable 26S proteasome regulatory subunit p28 [Zygosaccharomyces bailii]